MYSTIYLVQAQHCVQKHIMESVNTDEGGGVHG